MIDPKLNDIPVNRPKIIREDSEVPSEDENPERTKTSRAGLSINDTIAGGNNLSVGSRGVDTSGVSSGAGAGAGMSSVSPGSSKGSPAAEIVPGGRGSGTTARGDGNSEQTPTLSLDRDPSETYSTSGDSDVAARAYECWHERGCPEGSPEVDWQRAQEEVRLRRRTAAAGGN